LFKISIIGSGHVGLVTGVVFAEYKNKVICMDNDEKKIDMLKKGIMPIYEPKLSDLVKKNVEGKRLSFTTSIQESVENSEIIFICVGTPPKENGEPNLYYVEKVSKEVAKYMREYKLIVEKSTVPVETGYWIEKTIRDNNIHSAPFDVASNPEFLREGSAIDDTMHPERIVIGTNSEKARKILEELYKPFNAPFVFCDIKTAELIKHASNAFLAMKISYINAIANICERVGADVKKVAEGMGYDKRIGHAFLQAGVGYGGFCFPKDLQAFIKIAEKTGYDFALLKEVEKINNQQKKIFVEKIKNTLWILEGKTIGILGLSFKPNTDDMRFAPSIEIISELQREGANIKAYDPQAINEAKKILKNVEFVENPYIAAKDSDALAIITEWDEFKNLDLEKIKNLLKQPIIFDGRNIFEREEVEKFGIKYFGVGR
jgi:UDPglucose 6-dehydrogenase